MIIGLILFRMGTSYASGTGLDSDGQNPSAAGIDQSHAADSLHELLGAAGSDSEKIIVLNQFASGIIDIEHDLALRTAGQALELATAIGDRKGQFSARFHMAQVYANYTQEYEKAVFQLTEILGQAEANELEPHFDLMVLKLLGFVHRRLGNNDLAKLNYKAAIALAEEHGFRSDYSDLNSYMGDLLESEGKNDEAIAYYKKILDLESQYGFEGSTSGSYVAIARYFELTGQLEKASSYYEDAARQFEREGNLRWAAYAYGMNGELQMKMGKSNDALASAFKGLELARSHNLTKELADNHGVLASIFEQQGNHERALFHFKARTAINDSIFTLGRTREIAGVVAEYERKMRENDLAQALQDEAQNAKEKEMIAYFAFGGFFLIGLFAIFIYRGYRMKQRVNVQLEDRVELKDLALSEIVQQLKSEIREHKETQNKLQSSSRELNHFIYKSSHDLKGPLASIMGLADIANADMRPEERSMYLDLIVASSMRLGKRLDALIHVTILADKDLDFRKTHPKSLVEDILQQFSEEEFAKGVQVKLEIPEDFEMQTDEYFLQTILSNLIENGMRYKNLKGNVPCLKVTAQHKGQEICFEVSDNGRGIDERLRPHVFEMFTKSDMEFKNSGLGMYLVKRAVDRLEGEIHLESSEGTGTLVEVKLPFLENKSTV